jgi:hypothetical protein
MELGRHHTVWDLVSLSFFLPVSVFCLPITVVVPRTFCDLASIYSLLVSIRQLYEISLTIPDTMCGSASVYSHCRGIRLIYVPRQIQLLRYSSKIIYTILFTILDLLHNVCASIRVLFRTQSLLAVCSRTIWDPISFTVLWHWLITLLGFRFSQRWLWRVLFSVL